VSGELEAARPGLSAVDAGARDQQDRRALGVPNGGLAMERRPQLRGRHPDPRLAAAARRQRVRRGGREREQGHAADEH
jgi:hypothetical protein